MVPDEGRQAGDNKGPQCVLELLPPTLDVHDRTSSGTSIICGDAGLRVFRLEPEMDFVNFERGSEDLKQQAFLATIGYRQPNTGWADLHAEEVRTKHWLLKTNCRSMTRQSIAHNQPSYYKYFVALPGATSAEPLRNLLDYITLLQRGRVSYEAHMELFVTLFDRALQVGHATDTELPLSEDEVVLISHNMDVPVLHFKYEPRQDLGPRGAGERRRALM